MIAGYSKTLDKSFWHGGGCAGTILGCWDFLYRRIVIDGINQCESAGVTWSQMTTETSFIMHLSIIPSDIAVNRSVVMWDKYSTPTGAICTESRSPDQWPVYVLYGDAFQPGFQMDCED